LRIEAPCDSNPCQNNGTCSNNKNDTSPYYTCGCPYGYSGQDCQIVPTTTTQKTTPVETTIVPDCDEDTPTPELTPVITSTYETTTESDCD
jgi:hypothetical protein